MNLMRLLLFLAIVWLVYQLVLRPWASKRRVQRRAPRQVQAVRCAHCGVHVPAQEAVQRGGRAFCCNEHSQLGPR
ncbi:MAG: PP0621 family protein, partial [Thiohalomonadaceae bacterium]